MKNLKKISDKRKKLLTVLSVIFIVTAVSIFTENIFKISGQAVPNPGHSLGDILIDQDLDMGAHCIGLGGVTECSWPGGAGTIDGGGTANYIPKWTGATTLGDSVIIEDAAGNVGIGTNAPAHKLDVAGSICNFRGKCRKKNSGESGAQIFHRRIHYNSHRLDNN